MLCPVDQTSDVVSMAGKYEECHEDGTACQGDRVRAKPNTAGERYCCRKGAGRRISRSAKGKNIDQYAYKKDKG